jgi:hypothetical protein
MFVYLGLLYVSLRGEPVWCGPCMQYSAAVRTVSILLAVHGNVYRVIVKTGNASAIKLAIKLRERLLLSSATPLGRRYRNNGGRGGIQFTSRRGSYKFHVALSLSVTFWPVIKSFSQERCYVVSNKLRRLFNDSVSVNEVKIYSAESGCLYRITNVIQFMT